MRQPVVTTDSVAHDHIRAFVERIERLHEERTAIGKDISEVFAEAKGNGFDVKALKIVIGKRRQDHAERMELEAIVELYEAALGMAFTGRYHDNDEDARPSRARAHVEIINEFGEFPETAFPASAGAAADVGGGENAPALHVDTNPETHVGEAGAIPVMAAEPGGEGSGTLDVLPAARVMSMTPLEPRTAGGLKGFGFTVSFDERPVVAGGVQVPHRGEVA